MNAPGDISDELRARLNKLFAKQPSSDTLVDSLLPSYGATSEERVQIRGMYERLQDCLGNSFIPDQFHEAQELLLQLKKATQQLKTIEEYEAQRPGWNLEAVSFRNMTNKHLNRMGIEVCPAIPESVFMDHLPELLKGDVEMPEWDFYHLDFAIQRLGYVNLQSEAGSRTLIDQLFYCIIDHSPVTDNLVFLLPELVLSESKDGSLPVYIENEQEKKVTLITGITDYGILVLPYEHGGLAHETIKAGRKIDNKLDLLSLPGGRFLVAEAKGVSNLREWLKQVAAQALAVSALVPRLPCIPFTLTNGTHWIFGVLDTSASKRVIRYSEQIHFSNGKPQRFMEALFLWVHTGGERLRDMLINCHTSTTA
ncbi:hypothetical protein HWV62_22403 [Athelia sp. TMB]|nr:hypothetical protein HWV62_22403 [Athelia sp. TMB]